jgi:hypothetical protein
MLNKTGTTKVLRGFAGTWWQRTMVDTTFTDSVSCSVVVTRDLWDRCNGFDERFVGWGFEDTAFRITAEAFGGPILKVGAEVYHLWHPVSPEAAKVSPHRMANRRRLAEYEVSRWDADALAGVVKDNRSKVVPVPVATTGGIPELIFRTTPAETTPEVEAWWDGFAELHPGWDLRTYAEPIDPDDWPLTGHLFDKCQNGAQKAGLIRLEGLVRHGGFYVDSDVEPLRSFASLTSCHGVAGWEDETIVPDAVMACAPGHPAFEAMLAEACKRVDAGMDAYGSGPAVSTMLLVDRPDVTLLPPGAFYPYHYLEKSKRDTVTAESVPWAFCAHHWHHSWGTPAQRKSIQQRQR